MALNINLAQVPHWLQMMLAFQQSAKSLPGMCESVVVAGIFILN